MTTELLLNPAAAAAIVGVHPKTLNEWSDQGLIPAKRTPGGHRRYREQDVRALLTEAPPTKAVSS